MQPCSHSQSLFVQCVYHFQCTAKMCPHSLACCCTLQKVGGGPKPRILSCEWKGREKVEIILLQVGNLWHAGTLNRVKNDSVPLLYRTVALPQLQLCYLIPLLMSPTHDLGCQATRLKCNKLSTGNVFLEPPTIHNLRHWHNGLCCAWVTKVEWWAVHMMQPWSWWWTWHH